MERNHLKKYYKIDKKKENPKKYSKHTKQGKSQRYWKIDWKTDRKIWRKICVIWSTKKVFHHPKNMQILPYNIVFQSMGHNKKRKKIRENKNLFWRASTECWGRKRTVEDERNKNAHKQQIVNTKSSRTMMKKTGFLSHLIIFLCKTGIHPRITNFPLSEKGKLSRVSEAKQKFLWKMFMSNLARRI